MLAKLVYLRRTRAQWKKCLPNGAKAPSSINFRCRFSFGGCSAVMSRSRRRRRVSRTCSWKIRAGSRLNRISKSAQAVKRHVCGFLLILFLSDKKSMRSLFWGKSGDHTKKHTFIIKNFVFCFWKTYAFCSEEVKKQKNSRPQKRDGSINFRGTTRFLWEYPITLLTPITGRTRMPLIL